MVRKAQQLDTSGYLFLFQIIKNKNTVPCVDDFPLQFVVIMEICASLCNDP